MILKPPSRSRKLRGDASVIRDLCREIQKNSVELNAIGRTGPYEDDVNSCVNAHQSLCAQLGMYAGSILELLRHKRRKKNHWEDSMITHTRTPHSNKPGPHTQVSRVLKAYRDGARSTSEVVLDTGIPIKHCAAIARLLERRGLLIRQEGVRPYGAHVRAIFRKPAEGVR